MYQPWILGGFSHGYGSKLPLIWVYGCWGVALGFGGWGLVLLSPPSSTAHGLTVAPRFLLGPLGQSVGGIRTSKDR